MEDWKFAQKDPSECLAKLHFYSVTKKHACGEIEAHITVKEFATCKTTEKIEFWWICKRVCIYFDCVRYF